MKKFKMFFHIVEEEKWLNEQLQQGYRCTKISNSGIYTFEKVSEDYVVRLDYQDFLPKERFVEYKTIYEDFGWSHVKGSRFGSIQYWQKEAGVQNEIFSDRQSISHYYKRLMKYSLSLGLTFLVICFYLYNDGIYLTEGLWEMKGRLFWLAFLFETPFALFRLIPLFLLFILSMGFFKAYRQYAAFKEN